MLSIDSVRNDGDGTELQSQNNQSEASPLTGPAKVTQQDANIADQMSLNTPDIDTFLIA